MRLGTGGGGVKRVRRKPIKRYFARKKRERVDEESEHLSIAVGGAGSGKERDRSSGKLGGRMGILFSLVLNHGHLKI